ncbi:response regulator [Chryseomicrobium sp. FSL W7-1435]|uniref:response regulator n=1 Tax=Chryseomicrobium sp. FSL W7-1435 TaxID=2921704 RepID=UPI00315AEFFE
MDIWLLEDDFRIAAIHADYITALKPEARVRQFLTGTALQEALLLEQPTVLLMDLYIPDVEGYELVKQVRATYPAIRIVMVTAANSRKDVETLHSYGVFDYLVKPFDESRLHKTFKQLDNTAKALSCQEAVTQSEIDALFYSPVQVSSEKAFPKGIDALTLEKVAHLFQEKGHSSLTATEVSRMIGTSRSTARRYLEHLVEDGVLETQLLYGSVGRPERSYVLCETYEQN